MKYWKLTLIAAALAFAVPLVFVSSAAIKVVDEWNIKGLQDGLDAVAMQAVPGGAPMLRLEKKSAYEPGRFLYAFKNFSGSPWRARLIRMRYDIEAKGLATRVDNNSEPVLVRISMQCGQYSDSTFETRRSLDGKDAHYLDFKVPDDAGACSFGFSTGIASSLLVKNVLFEEADPAPSDNDMAFPLPTAVGASPTLEPSR
ncbi:MAG: hypothetical protein ABIT83_15585 [Massilia sp.]